MNISVLGCGRWGSFIAWYLNKINHNVILWGRPESAKLKNLIVKRKNDLLELNEKILITDDLNLAVNNSEIIIISISAQALRSFAVKLSKHNFNLNNKKIVLCMKGIEENTGKRLTEVLGEYIQPHTNTAVWVGPGHAQTFTQNIPNCMVIDSCSSETKNLLVNEFSSPLIRFYYGTDLIGNEIGAAAKNVMGIAAGILDGMGFESLKGALMARGTKEISRLIKTLGGNEMSAYGLCHLGDYQATLFSEYSNNRKFGECLVTKKPYEKLAEGVATARALVNLGQKHNVDLPISQTVNDIIIGKIEPQDAIVNLFLRNIKCEF